MKIRWNARAGSVAGQSYTTGATREVDTLQAVALILSGHAEPVDVAAALAEAEACPVHAPALAEFIDRDGQPGTPERPRYQPSRADTGRLADVFGH